MNELHLQNLITALRARAKMASEQGGGERSATPSEFRGSGAVLGETIPEDMLLQLQAMEKARQLRALQRGR
jgi:hypothetical protein